MKPIWSFMLTVCLGALATMSYGALIEPGVRVQVSSTDILIVNETSQAVFYAIFETEILTRIEWGPTCTDQNRILPKGSVRIPLKSDSFEPSGEANIFWWHQGEKWPNATSCGPDKIKRITVKIR